MPSRHNLRVAVVRPYDKRVRERVFRVLTDAGCDMAGADVIAAGTSDEDALARLQQKRFDVLLCPFNAHRGQEGELFEGLSFLEAMHDTTPLRPPVIMPISSMGRAAFELMLPRVSPELREFLDERVMLLDETLLHAPGLDRQVSEFIRTRRGTLGGGALRA